MKILRCLVFLFMSTTNIHLSTLHAQIIVPFDFEPSPSEFYMKYLEDSCLIGVYSKVLELEKKVQTDSSIQLFTDSLEVGLSPYAFGDIPLINYYRDSVIAGLYSKAFHREDTNSNLTLQEQYSRRERAVVRFYYDNAGLLLKVNYIRQAIYFSEGSMIFSATSCSQPIVAEAICNSRFRFFANFFPEGQYSETITIEEGVSCGCGHSVVPDDETIKLIQRKYMNLQWVHE